jgi:hypothetical protein
LAFPVQPHRVIPVLAESMPQTRLTHPEHAVHLPFNFAAFL